MATYALKQNGETINTIVLNNLSGWPIPDGCELVLLPEPEPTPIDLPSLKQQRLSDLAAYRYEKETAGITLNGAVIKTDLESQANINGAWSYAQINPSALIDWKAATGWIQIDAAAVTAIAGAVAAHVQACFSAERVHAEAIAALETAEAAQAYDITTGWPS